MSNLSEIILKHRSMAVIKEEIILEALKLSGGVQWGTERRAAILLDVPASTFNDWCQASKRVQAMREKKEEQVMSILTPANKVLITTLKSILVSIDNTLYNAYDKGTNRDEDGEMFEDFVDLEASQENLKKLIDKLEGK